MKMHEMHKPKFRAATRGTRPGAGDARPGAYSRISCMMRVGGRRLKAVKDRIEDSILGDVLGLACIVVIMVGVPFVLWGFSS